MIPGGPRRARESRSASGRQGSLLRNCTIYLAAKRLKVNRKDYEATLRMADARVFPLAALPKNLKIEAKETAAAAAADASSSSSSSSSSSPSVPERHHHVVICDSGRIDRAARQPVQDGLAVAVSEAWAHDSISNFRLMPFDAYLQGGR